MDYKRSSILRNICRGSGSGRKHQIWLTWRLYFAARSIDSTIFLEKFSKMWNLSHLNSLTTTLTVWCERWVFSGQTCSRACYKLGQRSFFLFHSDLNGGGQAQADGRLGRHVLAADLVPVQSQRLQSGEVGHIHDAAEAAQCELWRGTGQWGGFRGQRLCFMHTRHQ